MGVSTNSSVFLSDKDPKPMDQEFGLRVRPTREIQREDCKTSIPEEDHKKQFTRLKKLSLQECDQEEHKIDHQENQRYNIIVPVPVTPPPLMLKKLEIPSYEVITENDDSSNDGFKTPTSLDHKIPPMLECPGAPRKKITRTPTKRKAAACHRRLVFDMSKEVESMFTTSFMEDLPAGASDKNKKLKNCLLSD